MTNITEAEVEDFALECLQSLGWQVLNGPDVAPGEIHAERDSYQEVILRPRLRDAMALLNPGVPASAVEDAVRRLTNPPGATLQDRNRAFHRMLVDGVQVELRDPDGRIRGARLPVVDFQQPLNNSLVAINQFSVVQEKRDRRADVVLFVNGLPLAVLELKNPANQQATLQSAINQLQTYLQDISNLFTFNEVLVVADGPHARIGTITSGREWFMPWRTIEGHDDGSGASQLEVLLKGVFHPERFLALVRHFIVFEDFGGGNIAKKMAGYHQFHAVNRALEATLQAASSDRRIGVIWHTQGSGKSLTMVFYSGRVIRSPEMHNPTIVVITDRNDLDDQLFGTFSRCSELLDQLPVQAESRDHLRELLKCQAGGVIFTTIQKFLPPDGSAMPALSDRRNIVVIADEAHRSQYDFIDGFARHMRDALPGASFVGFTGTPIELGDRDTRAVFGDYIHIYDIERAVEDGATVPIYYESRLAKLALDESERPHLDEEFEEVTEGEEPHEKEKLKTKWAQLEALVGAEKRIRQIAADIVEHFEKRLETLEGKAMVVCMSRRICVELYDAIVAIRPQWHDDDDARGQIKVVMTGSAGDPPGWQKHIRDKARREALARRFKDPADPLKIVIVRDMWLTGFDAPCLHTMYLDKPMRGHGLMQAIARVNRVFRDKPGGLVVDYLGIAHELKKALAVYTESGGLGRPSIDKAEAVAVMLEKYEVCCQLFHGFGWSGWASADTAGRLQLLAAAQEHILARPDGKDRLITAVNELSRAFALAVPDDEAIRIRDDVAFFQSVKGALAKKAPGVPGSDEDVEAAIKQLISQAVVSEGVVDIFASAGLRRPDISVLSDEFLAEVRGMPQKNLAVETLRKLLEGEIRSRSRKNVVLARSFTPRLSCSGTA